MRLEGEDGATFELLIDGYQFPNIATDYWDSNWLIVHGQVINSQGNWAFRDPCMTTFELEQLATWFDGVTNGNVDPDNGYFTEPNLHFEYVITPISAIQVTFANESAPPWLGHEGRFDGAIIRFPLALNDPGAASRSLRAILSNFPVRGLPEGDA